MANRINKKTETTEKPKKNPKSKYTLITAYLLISLKLIKDAK